MVSSRRPTAAIASDERHDLHRGLQHRLDCRSGIVAGRGRAPLRAPREGRRRVLIRECSETDLDALDRFLPTRPPRQVHAEHFALQDAGRWTYLVAWDDDAVPVGVGVIRWEGWSDEAALAALPGCPVLTNLQVQEARRGQGVGTALIQVAEELVRARGFGTIGIAVADDNPKAAKLYANLGYAGTGLRSESRYRYPDDSGVPREIVECDVLLIKALPDAHQGPGKGP